MKPVRYLFLVALMALLGVLSVPNLAEAKHYHRGYVSNRGNHYGHYKQKARAYRGWDQRYQRRGNDWVDYKTGKIIKGGLIGAGVGAGAGLLLDRPVGKTALVGAGIGAGTQAVRYSSTLRRHPIVKTTAYGALAGTGVSAATGRSLGSGAVWGGAIGAGLGALRDF